MKRKFKKKKYFKFSRPKQSHSYSAGPVSPSGDAMIQTMKNYLKAAGIKKVKFSKLWEGKSSKIFLYFFFLLKIILESYKKIFF